MAARRATVYLSDPTLEALGDHAGSLSGRIAEIVAQYRRICADECPTLSDAEWGAIRDALHGTWSGPTAPHRAALLGLFGPASPAADPTRWLWAEVADADGLGAKWGIDAEALSQRLRGMRYAARCAVVDVCMMSSRGSPPPAESGDERKKQKRRS